MTELSGSHAAAGGGENDPLVGTTLGGRYAIERVVGWGGMGVVYLATDGQEDGREVVIKVLARQLLHDDLAKQRFDREAASLKSLRHANIVEMYGFEREGDRGYIVMEYLDGELLSSYLAENGALTVAEFVPIAAQVLKGAGYAHSREVVLRDLKPENMMLCERKGRSNFVKMLDFGLAKLLNDDKQITKEEVIGTIGYIAPEVIAGTAADLRADVYALGVMFYRMLSGQLPFPSDDQSQAALLYKTVNAEVPALVTLIPDGHEVPADLLQLVHDCLEKDPEQRPADANVVVERLIDAVPAALFRLPQSAVHSGTFAARLARRERPAADVFTRPTAAVPASAAASGTAPATAGSDSGSGDRLAPVPAEPTDEEPASGGGLWIAIAAAVLLTAGVVVGLGLADDDPPVATPSAPKVAVAGTAQTPAVEAAPTTLVEPSVSPAPAVAEDPKPVAPVGVLSVTSSPEGASVLLDEAVVGTTPFEGAAPLGSHELTVRAKGHEDWTQTVVVTEGQDTPTRVSADLEVSSSPAANRPRRGRRGHRDSRTPAADPTPTPVPDKPAPTLPSGKTKSSRSDSLLTETDAGKKSSVLLPGSN